MSGNKSGKASGAGKADGKVGTSAPAGSNAAPRQRATRPCPICQKASDAAFHPFCSKRCAEVDLNRWLTGSYAIPAVEPPDEVDLMDGMTDDEAGGRG